jgi:copper resistance protein C
VRTLALGLLLASAAFVRAHAFLDRADPRVGATVEAAPPALRLFLTEGIESAFSRVEVDDANGQKLAPSPPSIRRRTRSRVPLPALAAGEYTVRWSVVSVDTHPTEGKFTFSVKGARR